MFAFNLSKMTPPGPYANGWERLALELATVLSVGRLPWAPGTFGTLAAVPLVVVVQWGGVAVEWLVFGVVCLVGTWSAEVACRVLGRKDPSQVVIDEVAGFLLTMLAAPSGWIWMGIGFCLFRLFDIFKPWPVNWVERLPGGWGVMADDLAAGVYAGLVINLIARIWVL